MVYVYPYEADFECSEGHKFLHSVNGFLSEEEEITCPHCYQEWVLKNIPRAKQTSRARVAKSRDEVRF